MVMQATETLTSFFRSQLDEAFRTEGVERDEHTEHYLVRLLSDYAAQPIDDAPLALRLMSAMSEPPVERRQHLREIGDTSLFISGFWSDSLVDKPVDVDYYIALGGSAYGFLARAQPPAAGVGEPHRSVFAQLAGNFGRFVEVLMTVRQRTWRARNPTDMVRLYERWMRTRSRWAARRLAELGVLTSPSRGGGGMVQ